MKRLLFLILAALSLAARPALGWPTVYPTGTTVYDPAKAYNGYTLFTPIGDESRTLHLINMNGKVVHEWKFPLLILRGRLLPNGHVLIVAFNPKEAPGRPGIAPFWMGGPGGVLTELNWQGDSVFRRATDLNMHHDAVKLPNGNYLYLAWERIPPSLQAKVRGGIADTEHREPKAARAGAAAQQEGEKVMFNDVLIEVTPKNKIVWEWHANEHLDPDIDIIGPTYPRQEWCHTNAIELLQNGNILLTSRTLDALLIVDKQSGNVTFRWGNMAYLDKPSGEIRLRTGLQTLSGPHDGRQIPAGLPGAGNLTCYDNGAVERGLLLASRVVEVNPATGEEVFQSARILDNMLWDFGRKHYSHLMGSAQKLPNGNYLLNEGMDGRFFQINEKLEIVWEYVSPYTGDRRYNGSVFKIDCYPPDYCPQFKDLPPAKGAAVRPAPVKAASAESEPTAGFRPDTVILVFAAAIAATIALLTFGLGWKLAGRSQTPRRGKFKATQPTARSK